MSSQGCWALRGVVMHNTGSSQGRGECGQGDGCSVKSADMGEGSVSRGLGALSSWVRAQELPGRLCMAPHSRSSLQQNTVLRLPWTEGTISFLGWILQLLQWFRDPVPSHPLPSCPAPPHPTPSSCPMVEQRPYLLLSATSWHFPGANPSS